MIFKLAENKRLNKMLLINYKDPSETNNHTLSFEVCDRVNDDDIMNMLLKKYITYSNIEIIGAKNITDILDDIRFQILMIIPIEVIDYYIAHILDNSISNIDFYNLLKSNNITITNVLGLNGSIHVTYNYKFPLNFIFYTTNSFDNINISFEDNNIKENYSYDPFNIEICFPTEEENTYHNEEEEILLLLSIVKKYCALKLFCDDVIKYIDDYIE